MQWVLQEFEDTVKLGAVLARRGVPHSWHKVVPFVGDLTPEPQIADRKRTLLFGAYTLWRYAEAYNLSPGVFRITPFIDQPAWQPFLLNGADGLRIELREVPLALPRDETLWFLRPVDDSKAEPGRVRSADEIHALAAKVLALPEADIPLGSLRPETELMLCPPVTIAQEWRVWVVEDEVVTWSLYKEGRRVTYRAEIDEDALAFARHMVALNPGYAQAYVIDICRVSRGLRVLETNCINAAGFYAADLERLVTALEALV